MVLLIDERRDAATLIPLIKKYILPGCIIISDEWAVFRKLTEHGYIHKPINHSEHFVDPDDPEIHTQNIERLWKDARSYILRPGIRKEYYHQYLAKYLFLHSCPNRKRWLKIFESRLYLPQSDRGSVSDEPNPSGVPWQAQGGVRPPF